MPTVNPPARHLERTPRSAVHSRNSAGTLILAVIPSGIHCCECSANHLLRKPTPRRFSRLAASVRPSINSLSGFTSPLQIHAAAPSKDPRWGLLRLSELTTLPNPCSRVKWCKIVATSNMRKLNQERQILQVVAEIWILLAICMFIALRIIDSHLFRSFVSRLKGL